MPASCFLTREQCEELRSIKSKQNQDQVCQERNEQILLKEEERKRQEEIEKMYTNLWETDRIAKSEREEDEEKNLIERNRECLKVGTDTVPSKVHLMSSEC